MNGRQHFRATMRNAVMAKELRNISRGSRNGGLNDGIDHNTLPSSHTLLSYNAIFFSKTTSPLEHEAYFRRLSTQKTYD
jgi:hypothetical protein